MRTCIEARSGSKRVEGRAWETPKAGVYRASITIPETGWYEIWFRLRWIDTGADTATREALPAPAIPRSFRGTPFTLPGGKFGFACRTCNPRNQAKILA